MVVELALSEGIAEIASSGYKYDALLHLYYVKERKEEHDAQSPANVAFHFYATS